MSSLTVNGLKAITGVFTALACSFTIGRFIIRKRTSNAAGLAADYLNAAAALVLIAFVTTNAYYLPLYYSVQLWAAKQGPPVALDQMNVYFRVEFSLFLLFWVVIYLVKFSFLFLYRALFAVSKPFRAAWWGVFGFTVMSFLACALGVLWMCEDPTKLWSLWTCGSKLAGTVGRHMIIMGCVFNVVSDVACMALPLVMLHTLRVTNAQKVGLAGVFTVALVIVAIDIMRTVATFTATINSAFNILEPCIAVLVCALPTYRSVVVHSLAGGAFAKLWSGPRSWFSSSRSRGSKSSGSPYQSLEKRRLAGTGSQGSDSSGGSSGLPTPAYAAAKAPFGITVRKDLEANFTETIDPLATVDDPMNYGIHYAEVRVARTCEGCGARMHY